MIALLIAAVGCGSPHPWQPTASHTEVRLDVEGARQRPAVVFDHHLHTEALADEGCETCHDVEDGFDPRFESLDDDERPAALVDRIHDRCMSCHTERDQGTLVCGGCHSEAKSTPEHRAHPTFDASLHHRHVAASAEECSDCHHAWDEDQQQLVYVEGVQGACSDCHGSEEVDGRPTLRDAAHTQCVGCHLEHQGRAEPTGPVSCEGCHDAEALAKVRTVDPVPRLDNEQPDHTVIHAEGADSAPVSFDHLGHESQAAFCTTCHHQTAQACSDCHTVAGTEEGGEITLQQAHHARDTDRSCVGCHERSAREPECAGCHAAMPPPPSEASCTTCHAGAPHEVAVGEVDTGDGEPGAPAEVAVSAELAPLPPISDDFPEEVVIDTLVDAYEPSVLPHARIVRRLDQSIRASELATAFHHDDAVCASCHHQGSATPRPTGCESCHTEQAHPTEDQPSLKAAYHRQCMGCHEQMGLDEVGCTDCHDERGGAR